MNNYKKQRLLVISLGVLSIAVAITIILLVFRQNIVFFYSPTDLQETKIPAGKFIRVGGLVKAGSLQNVFSVEDVPNGITSLKYVFVITDMNNDLTIEYGGSLPDLFRDEQGIVAEGSLNDKGIFEAEKLLAKHDENYMPPEVADALKKSGHWKKEYE